MNSLYNKIIDSKILYFLLALAGVAFLFSFYHRYIEDDEAVLGEYSYHFLKEGIVRWKTLPGILNFDERVFPYHKFYTWTGALIIQMFGWSIYALKTSTLVWYSLFFIFLYKYFQLSSLPEKKHHFLIGSLIIFTAPIILLKSFSFRPDVLLMTEGLGVLYFLKRYRIKGSVVNAALAGMVAGLGFLTHLNGIAFCVTGFFLLLIFKEYRALIVFTITGALIGGIYFIELLPPENFEGFIYQLTNWPTVNHGENYIGGDFFSIVAGRIVKLLSEHQRFFWGDKVAAFSALFFVALIFSFKKIKANDKEVLYYILILIPALNIFGSHVAERYVLFYYGPMAIISAMWIYDLQFRKSAALKVLTLTILILHMAFAVKMLVSIYNRSYDTVGTHQRILSSLEDQHAKILAPYAFIYDGYDEYDLYAFKTYEYLQEDLTHQMDQEDFFSRANSFGMDYIIINQELKRERYMQWVKDWAIDPNPYYEIYAQNEDYLILQKKERITGKAE